MWNLGVPVQCWRLLLSCLRKARTTWAFEGASGAVSTFCCLPPSSWIREMLANSMKSSGGPLSCLREMMVVTHDEWLWELKWFSPQWRRLKWDRIAVLLVKGNLKRRPIQTRLPTVWLLEKRQWTQVAATEIQMGYKEKICHHGNGETVEQMPRDVVASPCSEVFKTESALSNQV